MEKINKHLPFPNSSVLTKRLNLQRNLINIIGMTMKKIITNAWAVTIAL